MSGTPDWFEDAELWTRFAPFMFDERRWAEAPAVAAAAASLAGLEPGDSALDLCCGPGRVAIELAALGLRVTGLDLQRRLLDAAADSAADRGLALELVRGDARSPRDVPAGRFDACFNLYTSFGYFDDPRDDLELARRAFDSLVPGGIFVVETAGKECVARDWVSDEWYEKDGALLLASYRAIDSWRYLENRWIVADGNGRFERRFAIRLYDAASMASLLAAAGFVDVATAGDFDGSPYDEKARTLVATGRKP